MPPIQLLRFSGFRRKAALRESSSQYAKIRLGFQLNLISEELRVRGRL
jgi:hypothetical protein